MFIRIVDEGLERFVRAEVPLPEDVGDVSFDVPNSGWSARLSRLTVNLFLYDVARSSHLNRAPVRRVDENGRAERRAPQPMVELSYLASVWAGDPRDEHQLLGELISRIAGLDVLPPEYLPRPLSSSVHLSFDDNDRHRTRDIWSGADATLKAGFILHATVAADTFGWAPEPPVVTTLEGAAKPGSVAKPR